LPGKYSITINSGKGLAIFKIDWASLKLIKALLGLESINEARWFGFLVKILNPRAPLEIGGLKQTPFLG